VGHSLRVDYSLVTYEGDGILRSSITLFLNVLALVGDMLYKYAYCIPALRLRQSVLERLCWLILDIGPKFLDY
jgi:hypothetical protein